jgi:hypothetical protein
MNAGRDKDDRSEPIPEQGEIQHSVQRHAEAGDRPSGTGGSLVFARLLAGLCAYLLWLYGFTYFFLRPEGLPSAAVQLLTFVFYGVAIAGLWLHRRREPLDDNAAQVEKRELRLVGILFAVLLVLALALSPLSHNPVLLGIVVPNFVIWMVLGVLLPVASLISCVRERTVP